MASKARLFYPDKLKTGTISRLSEKQSHYTKNVMRLKAGDKISLFNSQDGEWDAKILDQGKIFTEFKVEKLSTFDIEYLFLNIRGKSVGEKIEVMVTCPDDGKTQVPMSIDIDSIKIQRDKNHSTDIVLDDTYTLRMKYPSLNEFIKNNFGAVENMGVDDTFDLIASCIDQVYSEEESWTSDECTKKELSDFVESLNSSQFKLVENFFVTMPKLSHTIKVTNPNTKVESDVKIEGLQSFFG